MVLRKRAARKIAPAEALPYVVRGLAILTTNASPLMAAIHGRMPLILEEPY